MRKRDLRRSLDLKGAISMTADLVPGLCKVEAEFGTIRHRFRLQFLTLYKLNVLGSALFTGKCLVLGHLESRINRHLKSVELASWMGELVIDGVSCNGSVVAMYIISL